MVRLLLSVFIFIAGQIPSHCQEQNEERILFSEALALHLSKYENKAKTAYRYRDYGRAEFLFDSLIKHSLAGTYMDNFHFYGLNGKPVEIKKFKKPIYFITYASWCVTSKGEVPALNELARKYHKEIDFVILFWDNRKTAKRAAKPYNKYIKILYVDELKNKDVFVVKNLKHSLGLPTTFLLDKDKKILDIRRGVTHSINKTLEESLNINFNSILDGIANHLLGEKYQDQNTGTVAVN